MGGGSLGAHKTILLTSFGTNQGTSAGIGRVAQMLTRLPSSFIVCGGVESL